MPMIIQWIDSQEIDTILLRKIKKLKKSLFVTLLLLSVLSIGGQHDAKREESMADTKRITKTY